MIVSSGLDISAETIVGFCQRWRVRELALFGSVLRQDFDSKSDIDLLVSFSEDVAWSLIDLVHMEEERA